LKPDYFELFSRALTHYAKIFEDLKKDEEIKLGNGFVVKDLDDNAKKALEVAEELMKLRTTDIITDNQKIIKSAMEAYLNDLNKSKDTLMKKLSENKISSYTLYNINNEIQKVDEYLS
jgi:hypothetical protein